MSDTLVNDKEATIPLSALTGEGSPATEDKKDSPIDSAFAEDLLLSDGAVPKRSVGGVVIIVVVLVVAAGALVGMRQIGMRGHINFLNIDLKVPTDVTAGKQYTAVIADIKTDSAEKQVPLNNVKKNPFYIAHASKPVKEDNSKEEMERERLEREKQLAEQKRLAAIQKDLDSLHLQSIMGGSSPMALIDGNLFRAGDRLGEFFTVKSINNRSVTLTTEDGRTYEMSLGEGQ